MFHWFGAHRQGDQAHDDALVPRMRRGPTPLLKAKVVERKLVKAKVEANSKHGAFDSLNCLGAEGDLTHKSLNMIVLTTVTHICCH